MPTLTERFPLKVAFGFTGGARYSTSLSVNLAGGEKGNQNWTQTRGRWVATQQAKNEEDTEALVEYFHAAAGRANPFPFRDWTDYKVVSADGRVRSLGGGLYQLVRRYTRGGISRDRDIYLPVNAAVAGGGSYSVNTSTGVVTHNSGAAPTGWAGQFDCLCRFDDDEMNIEVINKRPDGILLFTWGGIRIVEKRLDE